MVTGSFWNFILSFIFTVFKIRKLIILRKLYLNILNESCTNKIENQKKNSSWKNLSNELYYTFYFVEWILIPKKSNL